MKGLPVLVFMVAISIASHSAVALQFKGGLTTESNTPHQGALTTKGSDARTPKKRLDTCPAAYRGRTVNQCDGTVQPYGCAGHYQCYQCDGQFWRPVPASVCR